MLIFFEGHHRNSHALKTTKPPKGGCVGSGGEKEIRTLEGLLTLAGFQDRCIKPLCHLSAMDGIIKTLAKLVKRFL
jgi:hypothetical protein